MVSEALTLFSSDNPIGEIGFVANKHDNYVGICLLLDVFKPTFNVIKGFFASDVVNYDSPASPPVMPTFLFICTPLLSIDTVTVRLKIVACLPVSQICALTRSPFFRVTVFVANSTPIVGTGLRGSTPLTYLFSR